MILTREASVGGHRFTTFWEEKRVVVICFIIAFAQFQYGYDSAAISGFQSMVGFLEVFGYADVSPLKPLSILPHI
jgi:hypothetical protein